MSCWVSLGCVDGQGIGAAERDGICGGRQSLGTARQSIRRNGFEPKYRADNLLAFVRASV